MHWHKFCDPDHSLSNSRVELRTEDDLSSCIIQKVAAVDPIQNPPLCSISRHAGLQFVRRSELLWAQQQSAHHLFAAEALRSCLLLSTCIANTHNYLEVCDISLPWITRCGVLPPVTNRSVNSSRRRQWFKLTPGAPQDPPGNVATGSSSTALRKPGERLHGFFASLTIYELPLHVIYTGLMVMLFGAQTPCRDPLG